jgi:peptidyl-prolyl cis-trans isomerase C
MSTLAYHRLKAAQNLFQRAPDELDDTQAAKVQALAQRMRTLEERILQSPKAQGVCVSETELATGLKTVRGRFETEADFLASLEREGLTLDDFMVALRCDQQVENTLERVKAELPALPRTDLEIFYYAHIARFYVPERRRVSHILMTVQEANRENQRDKALERIQALHQHLQANPADFAKEALRHSECPTALEGGVLGTVPAGTLYPELDAALFAMNEGDLSEPIETEMGFHILWCQAIEPEHTLPFEAVASKLREELEERRAQRHLKAWLKTV